MSAPLPSSEPLTTTPPRWMAAAEVLFIFLLFFLFAGWPPPDVNEAHYLAKAKSYWNPDWCPRDHFLRSADAHLAFYWTCGWLTRLMPLAAVAWTGRIVTWLLLAWAWQRLSRRLVPLPWFALLSAGLWLCFTSRMHMAGEWVVGGFEAKGFAYVFVLLGMAELVAGRWRATWLLFGAASSFHVLVGGWAVVAAGMVWVTMRVLGRDVPALASMAASLAGGLVLALPGLIPALALTWRADPEVVSQAHIIYVYERLGHHLVLWRFDSVRIAAFLLLLAGWVALAAVTPADDKLWRLRGFVLGTLVIALGGVALTGLSYYRPDTAASLLRFYWFRLSDVIVPLGAALELIALIAAWRACRPAAAAWLLAAAVLVAGVCLGEQNVQHRRNLCPAADEQSRLANRRDWRAACAWIAENTPADAKFLTPRLQTTFKWYAGRAELFSQKDIPQDAAAIVEWRARRFDLAVLYYRGRIRQGDWELGQPNPLYERDILDVADKYELDYVLGDRVRTRLVPRQGGLSRLVREYPGPLESNASYEVYRVLPAESVPPPPTTAPALPPANPLR